MAGCWGEEAKARQFSLWPVSGSVGTVKSLESPKQDFGIVKVLAATEHFFKVGAGDCNFTLNAVHFSFCSEPR